MADDRNRQNDEEPIGRMDEDVTGTADEDFEEIDELDEEDDEENSAENAE